MIKEIKNTSILIESIRNFSPRGSLCSKFNSIGFETKGDSYKQADWKLPKYSIEYIYNDPKMTI